MYSHLQHRQNLQSDQKREFLILAKKRYSNAMPTVILDQPLSGLSKVTERLCFREKSTITSKSR